MLDIVFTTTTLWAIALVVFLIIEAATVGLASIWFAAGSLAALVCSIFNAPLWLQIVWFFLVSCVALFFTRPLAKKYINTKHQPTNADRVIGASCIVTERIDNIAGTGAVSVDGKHWTARSLTGLVVEEGDCVTAIAIEGVKLIVAPPEEAGPQHLPEESLP